MLATGRSDPLIITFPGGFCPGGMIATFFVQVSSVGVAGVVLFSGPAQYPITVGPRPLATLNTGLSMTDTGGKSSIFRSATLVCCGHVPFFVASVFPE